MNELSTNVAAEALSPKSGDGVVYQEGRFHEAKGGDPSVDVEASNSKITEAIQNGTSPENLEKRIEGEFAQPEVQKQMINEFSPYSEQINSFVRSTRELSVYTQNNLQESMVLDRPGLQLNISPEKTDAMGRTNLERTATGRAPIDENGDSVNLHHIGQKGNSPLAELPDRVHKECDAVLHDKSILTEVHGEGNNWNEVRSQYWQERSKTL